MPDKFNFEEELAKVNANPPEKVGDDEFSESMHETFDLSSEDEKKHAVFAYLDMLLDQPHESTPEEMAQYGISTEDIRKYRKEWEAK